MKMSEMIEELKKSPLSNVDLKKIDPDIKITTMNELKNLHFADELLHGSNKGVLLWSPHEHAPRHGHWIGLLKTEPNTFEIFEPCGVDPMENLSEALGGTGGKKQVKQLKDIIRRNGCKMMRNKIPHQSLDDRNDQACGRHVLMRLAFNHLGLKEFHKKMRELRDADMKHDTLAVLGTTV